MHGHRTIVVPQNELDVSCDLEYIQTRGYMLECA